MQEQINQLQLRVDELNKELRELKDVYYRNNFTSTQVFTKDVEFQGAGKFTKIKMDKFGLGLEPIARQSAISAPSGGGASSTDAIDVSARNTINSIRSVLSAFGFTL